MEIDRNVNGHADGAEFVSATGAGEGVGEDLDRNVNRHAHCTTQICRFVERRLI
jgi:hypothetical protein